jgi:hypothetical protein
MKSESRKSWPVPPPTFAQCHPPEPVPGSPAFNTYPDGSPRRIPYESHPEHFGPDGLPLFRRRAGDRPRI